MENLKLFGLLDLLRALHSTKATKPWKKFSYLIDYIN